MREGFEKILRRLRSTAKSSTTLLTATGNNENILTCTFTIYLVSCRGKVSICTKSYRVEKSNSVRLSEELRVTNGRQHITKEKSLANRNQWQEVIAQIPLRSCSFVVIVFEILISSSKSI